MTKSKNYLKLTKTTSLSSGFSNIRISDLFRISVVGFRIYRMKHTSCPQTLRGSHQQSSSLNRDYYLAMGATTAVKVRLPPDVPAATLRRICTSRGGRPPCSGEALSHSVRVVPASSL
jgi:hypothetical protein